MLSSPRWTTFDMYLLIALCIFAMRITSGDPAQAGGQPSTPTVQQQTRAGLLDPPLHPARDIRYNSMDHVYLAVRCVGLAKMQQAEICSASHPVLCRHAKANVLAIERALWPEGAAARFASAFRHQSDAYAKAYRAAADAGYRTAISSSELILTRDSAMCRQSKYYYQARLHEYQDRQPG